MENSSQAISNCNDETSEIKRETNPRKSVCRTLKFLIFVGCLSGFGFQTAEFLTNFYKYPTVVNMDVKGMEEFPLPALTVCSQYW